MKKELKLRVSVDCVPWFRRDEIVDGTRERGAAIVARSVHGLIQGCGASDVGVAAWICSSRRLTFAAPEVLSLGVSGDGDGAWWRVRELVENLFESTLLVGFVECVHNGLRHGQSTVVLADVGRCNNVGHGCIVS